ncbi:hypothetical protein OQA88_9347 [Cercophora sp. LCS_1]
MASQPLPGRREDLEFLQAADPDNRASEGLQPAYGFQTSQYKPVEPQVQPVPYQTTPSPATYNTTAAVPAYAYPAAVPPDAAKPPKKILGLRPPTFFLTLTNILLAIGIIVVAVVLSRDDNTASQSSTTCPINTNNNTTTPGNTTTGAIPEGFHADSKNICFHTSEPPPSGQDPTRPFSECPLSSGNSIYTAPGTNLQFRRECDTDYDVSAGGADMGRFPARTMQDCIAICAQLNLYPSSGRGRCRGVTWVWDAARWGQQGTADAFCFPKNSSVGAETKFGAESAALLTTQ